MRERTIPVKTEKLKALSNVYKSAGVAKRLGVSRQLWHNYQNGRHDMPENLIDRICEEFKLERAEVVA